MMEMRSSVSGNVRGFVLQAALQSDTPPLLLLPKGAMASMPLFASAAKHRDCVLHGRLAANVQLHHRVLSSVEPSAPCAPSLEPAALPPLASACWPAVGVAKLEWSHGHSRHPPACAIEPAPLVADAAALAKAPSATPCQWNARCLSPSTLSKKSGFPCHPTVTSPPLAHWSNGPPPGPRRLPT